tara:strand:- start:65 stop:607 length:543 start_codon:yes stop_codon:yes gene_type:complete
VITEVNLIGITPEVIQINDFEKIKKTFSSKIDLLILRFETDKEFIKNLKKFIALAEDLDKKISISSRHIDHIPKDSNLHLNSKDLAQLDKRPISSDLILGASCHNEEEVYKAKKIDCDYLLISPIQNTKNKEGLGWDHFKTLAALSHCPCFALGGMKVEDIEGAVNNGGQGVAGISLLRD